MCRCICGQHISDNDNKTATAATIHVHKHCFLPMGIPCSFCIVERAPPPPLTHPALHPPRYPAFNLTAISHTHTHTHTPSFSNGNDGIVLRSVVVRRTHSHIKKEKKKNGCTRMSGLTHVSFFRGIGYPLSCGFVSSMLHVGLHA